MERKWKENKKEMRKTTENQWKRKENERKTNGATRRMKGKWKENTEEIRKRKENQWKNKENYKRKTFGFFKPKNNKSKPIS